MTLTLHDYTDSELRYVPSSSDEDTRQQNSSWPGNNINVNTPDKILKR
jgi:hypothetical protein